MDETENRKRLPPWAGKLLIWCLPALVLLLLNVVVFHLVLAKDTIITFCAIIILGLMVTRLIFLFRSERAPGAQAWRGVLWIVLLVVLGFFSLFMPRTNHLHTRVMAPRLFEAWTAKICGDTVPRPIELGTPKSAVVHIYRKSAAIFESRSYTLLCRYDEDDYEEEKAALETRYHFRNEPMKTGLGEPETIEPYVRIGDDFFRVVIPGDRERDDGYLDGFYETSFFIVTNDVRHEIGYVVFQDLDMDYAEDLAEFLNEDCGWKYIR
jgi:hypothetical protein